MKHVHSQTDQVGDLNEKISKLEAEKADIKGELEMLQRQTATLEEQNAQLKSENADVQATAEVLRLAAATDVSSLSSLNSVRIYCY